MTNSTPASHASAVASVCAIVVSYNPDLPVTLELLSTLNESRCDFIVIDNHSSNIEALRAAAAAFEKCRSFIALDQNIGQAAALNQALKEVADANYELALLFDQDSKIDISFVSNMLNAWQVAQDVAPGKVAALGPRLVEPRSGRRMPFRAFTHLFERQEHRNTAHPELIDTAFLITSGSLLPVAPLAVIGHMRSEYFIDNVDLEWCFRARAKGYRLFGTECATLQHRIGEDSANPLVRRGVIVQHNALRYYYSTRNRLHLHRQPYAPVVWRLKDSVRFALKSVYLLVTSPERKAFWSSLRRAIHDARSLP